MEYLILFKCLLIDWDKRMLNNETNEPLDNKLLQGILLYREGKDSTADSKSNEKALTKLSWHLMYSACEE